MNRILTLVLFLLAASFPAAAQQNPADAPATKEDIERYLQIMHSREMMGNVADAMAKPMRQMVHEQYQKQKDKLPPDFEARMTKMMDDMFKSMPWDEMLDAMVPVYEKHFTKGDVDALVAFYSTPTGQKLIKETPAIMAESMQNIMPLLRKEMETMNQRLQQEIEAMLEESNGKQSKAAPQIPRS